MNKKNPTPQLFLVHCVDTEGPLNETLEATFERLREHKSIFFPASLENLIKLQNKNIDLQGREEEIADYLNPKRISYMTNWNEVGNMLKNVTSPEFRMNYADLLGNPYTFTWLIIDIVGYLNNPRQKSTGFHSVLDNFNEIVKEKFDDAIGWHFHTVPQNQNAIEYNSCWTNNDWHEQSLCRRLIERNLFPSVFRAGGHIERNDLSFWLENFIPFDFSCRSYDPSSNIQYQPGDINDWRGAPTDWSPYNPCFYDYRKKGDMKRHIFRTLDIDSNAHYLTEFEVEKAFDRARKSPTILSVSTHDRRDMAPEIEHVMNLVHKVANRFEDVIWTHSNALTAARAVQQIPYQKKPEFTYWIDNNVLYIESDCEIFGPQPFLAIKEGDNLFYRDNLTVESPHNWAYRLPKEKNIRTIGLAASNASGEVGTKIIHLKKS